MYNLCHGNERFCDYDFSKISINDYEGFFNGLPNIIYKKVDSIRFSLDLYHKYDDVNLDIPEEDQSIIDESIYYQKRRFPHYLFKILNATLPKSRRLVSLDISGIRIPSGYVKDFITSATKCRTLRTIRLNNSRLDLDNFRLMLSTWRPFHFHELVFSSCEIDNEAKSDILRFLDLNEGTKPWKLNKLDLSGNDFNKADLSRFQTLLNRRRGITEDEENEKSRFRNERDSDDLSSHSRSSRSSRASRSSAAAGNRRQKSEVTSSSKYNQKTTSEFLYDEEEEEEEEDYNEDDYEEGTTVATTTNAYESEIEEEEEEEEEDIPEYDENEDDGYGTTTGEYDTAAGTTATNDKDYYDDEEDLLEEDYEEDEMTYDTADQKDRRNNSRTNDSYDDYDD